MAPRLPPRPGAALQPTARELLLHTWAGRLFLITAGLKLVIAAWRVAGTLPEPVRVTSAIATVGLAIAVGTFAWRLFVQIKRRLLWRVRRKLILSYIFIGVIPALLILVFFLFAGSLIFMNVSAYLFKDGYDAIVENARLSAQAAATEIARDPDSVQETLERLQSLRASKYPAISVAYLASDGRTVRLGPWQRLPPPDRLPEWLKEDFFAGSLGVPVKDSQGEEDLVVRAVVKVGPGGRGGAGIVGIPLGRRVTTQLHEQTGGRLEHVFDSRAINA